MIHFDKSPEPPDFDARVRAPGKRWLASHRRSRERLPDYWGRVFPELREAFHGLCAYTAAYTERGTVDHFVPISRGRALAYEWTNYRHASPWINACKQDLEPHELLDPLEVEDGWFEILLPSCQLVITEKCPPERRAAAETMLTRLQLRNGASVVRTRREWLRMYKEGELTLIGLSKKVPLIARAIREKQRVLRQKRSKRRKA